MMDSQSGAARSEWQAGWPTVLVAALGIALSTSHIYALGLFMAPLEKAFGWTRAQVGAGPFIASFGAIAGVALTGAMADRWGTRRVVIPGLILYGAAFGLLASTDGTMVRWYASWVLIAVSFPFVAPSVWSSGIVRNFRAARGLALAVALAGTGIGSALTPIVVEIVIERFGWRAGFLLFPIVTLVVVLPLAILLFDTRNRSAPRLIAEQRMAGGAGVSVGTGIRTGAFACLLPAAMLFAFGMLALMAHFIPLVSEQGLTRATAAKAFAFAGLFSIMGRLTTGYLLDRINPLGVAAVAFLIPLAPVVILLNFDGSFAVAALAAMLLGLSLGAEVDIVAFLTARYFGLRNYSTFLGLIHGISAICVGGGPLVGGLIHDRTGGYRLMLFAVIPAFILAAASIGLLLRQQVPAAGIIERKRPRAVPQA